MKDGKLVKLLRTLSPEEFRRFRRFLKSPFFTTNKHLLTLYDYFRKYHPEYGSPSLRKEMVFKKVFPGLPFNYNKLASLTQQMTRLLEDYFLWINLEASPMYRQRQLLRVFNSRNLFDFYERGYVRYLEKTDEMPYRDMEHYQHKIQLHAEYYFHPLNNKYDLEDPSLEILSDSLDAYFLIGKYRIVAALRNRERILSKKYPIRFLEAMEKERTKGWMTGHFLAELYELLFNLLRQQSADIFQVYKSLLFDRFTDLRKMDKGLLFYSGLNYIIGQINQGNDPFYQEALTWYKLSIDNQMIIERGRINEAVFSNIVLLGCREKDFLWTKGFIEEYGQYLNKSSRMDTILFSESLLLFHQRKFQESLYLLNSHSFGKDIQPKVRLTMIRNNFEQFLVNDSYYESLQSSIKAFEKYIVRDKYFSRSKIEPHVHCIRIIKQLSNKILAKPQKGMLLQWLDDELQRRKKVVVKDWLRSKVMELELGQP